MKLLSLWTLRSVSGSFFGVCLSVLFPIVLAAKQVSNEECAADAALLEIAPSDGVRGETFKFGQSACVSRDGRTVVVGANGRNNYQGAAYVYELKPSATGASTADWKETCLVPPSAKEAEEKKPGELKLLHRGSGFGFSCALDDNSRALLVGAPGHNYQRGTAFIYRLDAGLKAWKQDGTVAPPLELRTGDSFGWNAVVSGDGTTMALSAKGRNANDGEVFVYSCHASLTKCKEAATLRPPDRTDHQGPRGIRIRNNFGVAMAMNSKGTLIAAGATGYKVEQGAVYVFESSEESNEWLYKQRLISADPQDFGFFGYKVAMDGTGNTIVVGADGEDDYTGSVYSFSRESAAKEWSETQILVREDRERNDNFGGALALSSDSQTLIVAAPGAKIKNARDSGVVCLYKRQGDKWISATRLTRPESSVREADFFGWSIAVDVNAHRVVVTAPQSNYELGSALFTTFNAAIALEEEEEREL